MRGAPDPINEPALAAALAGAGLPASGPFFDQLVIDLTAFRVQQGGGAPGRTFGLRDVLGSAMFRLRQQVCADYAAALPNPPADWEAEESDGHPPHIGPGNSPAQLLQAAAVRERHAAGGLGARHCEFCGRPSGPTSGRLAAISSYRHVVAGTMRRVWAHRRCLVKLRGTEPRFPA